MGCHIVDNRQLQSVQTRQDADWTANGLVKSQTSQLENYAGDNRLQVDLSETSPQAV